MNELRPGAWGLGRLGDAGGERCCRVLLQQEGLLRLSGCQTVGDAGWQAILKGERMLEGQGCWRVRAPRSQHINLSYPTTSSTWALCSDYLIGVSLPS